MSRRRVLSAIAGIAIAVAVALLVVVPRAGNAVAGPGGVHDASALPERMQLCGRSWSKDLRARTFTAAQVRTEFGVDPVAVDPGPFAACPPGPCTNVAQENPCDVVIWVRVGQDAYLDYSLSGGP